MTNEREVVLAIRRILDAHGRLGKEARLIRNGDDLFANGMTGLAAVDVLLAVETTFGIVLPQEMISRQSVASINTILACVHRLQAQPLAA